MKERYRNIGIISTVLLLILLLGSMALMGTSSAQMANSQGKIDILVDGADVGNETTVMITNYQDKNNESISFSISTYGNISGDSVVNVTWEFGEGTVIGEEEVELSTAVNRTYWHEYDKEGKYRVNLTVSQGDMIYEDHVILNIELDERGTYLTALGAGLAVGIAGMGSGIGVGIAGAAGAGIIAEKPEKFGKSIVFQVLPQTQAIYGLLTAVLLLIFTKTLSGEGYVPTNVGIASIGIGLAVGIAGLSAIGQGIAASGGICAYGEKDELFGKGMVFSVLPETQAIYGLLVGILIMMFIGLMGSGVNDMILGDAGLGIAVVTIGAGLSVGIAGLSGIGQGIAASAGISSVAEKEDLFGKSIIFSVLPETQAIYGLLVAILLMLFTGLMGSSAKDMMIGEGGYAIGLLAIGAGLAVGVAGLSGIGQGIAAASGIGSIAEKEEIFGRSMVFSVLPETQAIYGLLIAILLLLISNVIGGTASITVPIGLIGVGAGIAVGIAGLSGIGQGIAAASGIATIAEDSDMFGRSMVFSVLPETQAIYGLLVSILLMLFSGFLGGEATATFGMGIAAVGAGLSIGIAGISGVGQGITSASATAAVAKREETFARGMIFSVMSETFAIFGLLIAIMVLMYMGFL